ncbi:MAG: CRTAC1 family protein [Verrucomicrobiaceae bacterium]|nr:CRTAC1 family protein [Verrucomicrobiaceae bacterium]
MLRKTQTKALGGVILGLTALSLALLQADEAPKGLESSPAGTNGQGGQAIAGTIEAAVRGLREGQTQLDRTVFRNETMAQIYENPFVLLWDRLRQGKPFQVLAEFPFSSLEVRQGSPWKPLDLGIPGIRQSQLNGDLRALEGGAFQDELDALRKAGWRIVQTEWHHSQFKAGVAGGQPQSVVSFELHAENTQLKTTSIIKGELEVTWRALSKKERSPVADVIKVRNTSVTENKGNSIFREWLRLDPREIDPARYPRVSPILVHDLNRDGLPEMILAGCNLVYWNRGKDGFRGGDFLSAPAIPLGEAGILADFTGDGVADFVSSGKKGSLLQIWSGAVGGEFKAKPRVAFGVPLEYPHALSAGDVDGDGDLDLFLGQWKQPYERGSMPTPYYDANDGYPDYLLLNNGNGEFRDATEDSGLSAKRLRRTFSASFADLDGDVDLDLVVVCDFSGVDVFRNDGKGKFTDVTPEWIAQRHGFGMSHVLDDFNGDGKQDIYMVGMSSTTARRLDRLGLGRKGYEKHDAMRGPMTFGNRMFLRSDDVFEQPDYRNDMARSGWAWGCTSADFDNDGDRDLYVSNGHLSGDSSRDYCTRFWCHDVYTGSSKPDPALQAMYTGILGGLGTDFSWNGFEHNNLFLNRQGKGFHNLAFLLGAAQEFDARAVVGADLDVDGRPDLLVVEYDAKLRRQRLHVLHNQVKGGGNWIGFHLQDQPGLPANGAVVRIIAGNRTWSRQLVTGDSFTAQHPATVHFGLGKLTGVQRLEVLWPNGKLLHVDNPMTGKYHLVSPAGS